MTASKKAKSLGCKSLSEVSRETEQSPQTLGNWYKNKPKLFKAVCVGVAKLKEQGK